MQASAQYRALARKPKPELELLVRTCAAPPLDLILDKEYRGWNTPWYCSALGIRKFIKGFFSSANGGAEGYNIPAVQNGLEAPWIHKPSADRPKRFGFYEIRRVREGERDALYPNALLLDYGASPRNMAAAPERLLRDYVVMPDPSRPDLLLGKAYLALGARLPVSYFVIEALRPSSFKP